MPLLLASFRGVTILAGNDLYLLRHDNFISFHLKGGVFHDECPHFVAETICAQMTLYDMGELA